MKKNDTKKHTDAHPSPVVSNDTGTPEAIEIPSYLSLKYGKASKTGQRSKGSIHYRILTDPAHQTLYITIIANDGGGYFSKEVLPFTRIEQCLQGINRSEPIPSKLFQTAFLDQSVNNAGFLAAILRAEKLLAPVPDALHQHRIQPNWAQWKKAMLTLTAKAENYQPEPAKPKGGKNSNKPKSIQPEITEPEPTELDDAEMELLQRSTLGSDITNQEPDEAVSNETPVSILDKSNAKKQRREKRENPSIDEASHDYTS